ncbi:uncharacterized protein TNCV_4986131 [Trichonephila clavipes]|nr:uncharacterized protein TNCV_4986131 [Trichonephila clavipes]
MTPAELFSGGKLITPLQKLVMVSDGTEFVVGDIEKLFDQARRNTKAKHEKWEKYYNRRRRNNNLEVWKAGKRVTVNIDQVRLYHQRENDENEIRVGNSDNSGSRYQASSFEGVRLTSNWSQNSKNSGSGERREVKGKVTGLKEDKGEGRTSVTNKRRPLIESSNESLTQGNRIRKEVIGYKRSINSRSGRPERKRDFRMNDLSGSSFFPTETGRVDSVERVSLRAGASQLDIASRSVASRSWDCEFLFTSLALK